MFLAWNEETSRTSVNVKRGVVFTPCYTGAMFAVPHLSAGKATGSDVQRREKVPQSGVVVRAAVCPGALFVTLLTVKGHFTPGCHCPVQS